MQVDWELSQSLTSDGQGVRGVGIVTLQDLPQAPSDSPGAATALVDSFKLVTGTQGGTMTEFAVPSASLETVQYQHDNAITAVICAENTAVITGSKDSKIRVFDATTRTFRYTLEGHEKPVTSLSSLGEFLVSGSWDGTAKIWNWKTKTMIATLSGHENSVCVAIVAPPRDGVLQVVTGSAGMAQSGNKIKDHAVRLWNVNLTTGQVNQVYQVANDHEGPIRDLCVFPHNGATLLATCSNDGTVKLRSLETGVCISTLFFVQQEQLQPAYPPMLLSLCCTMDTCLVASAEDGHVIVWDLAVEGANPATILHPACVWRVHAMSNGDFCSACEDGTVRIFTRATERIASQDERQAFSDDASASLAKKQGGPTNEEVAKLPHWERNNEKRGTSEGQVQLFQKNGIAIAAQWSMDSQTWIEVGQVMSGVGGAGGSEDTIDGVRYDHVLPVELENTGGQVVSLKIGYNTGENPFTAAQRFIDNHMLPQYHLSQIADYIQQRTGASGTPTLGMAQPSAASTGVPLATYQHIPIKHYLCFELASKSAASIMDKMKLKLVEFGKFSEQEMSRVQVLMDTIAATNRYHSSKVDDLSILVDMLNKLEASQSFLALDLARLTVLHPNAAEQSETLWKQIFVKAISLMKIPADQLGEGPAANAIPMLSLRLFANALKGGMASRNAVFSLSESILKEAVTPNVNSKNKNTRLSVATLLLNFSFACSKDTSSIVPVEHLVSILGQILSNHKQFEEAPILRTLQALGTLCISSPEAKQAANAQFLASKVEPAASPHLQTVKDAAKEVYTVLQ